MSVINLTIYLVLLQVTIEVDAIDRVGNFIGWLFVDGVNLSQLLVEKGLSKLHFTAERSNYYKQLLAAEDAAKAQKLNVSDSKLFVSLLILVN